MQVSRNILAQGENGAIVSLNIWFQKLPDFLIRLRGVYVAAPDPFCFSFAAEVREGRWLGVIYDDHIVFKIKMPCIFQVILQISLFVFIFKMVLGALERIMEVLGDFKEGFGTVKDTPIC